MYLNLAVNALQDPPPFLRVREVKEWYVSFLIKMLVDEKCDHEDLTAPLLAVASVGKDEFRTSISTHMRCVIVCIVHH